MAVWLAERAVRLRRAGRRDLEAVRGLLASPAAVARRTRFDRRLLADLGSDVYVAEAAEHRLVGVLAVSYVRSLADGRFVAVLDTLQAEPAQDGLLAPMLEFAEARARRRGCRMLVARPGLEGTSAGMLLEARGWVRQPVLARMLDEAD